MSNCEIYFPLFPEIKHAILKIFSQYEFTQCRQRLRLTTGVLEFLAKNF